MKRLDDFAELPSALGSLTLGDDPVVKVLLDARGLPVAACAAGRIDAPVERVFAVLDDVEKYAARVPLIDRVRVRGDSAEFLLRMKLAFFSVRFSFESRLERVAGKTLNLDYLAGEPRNIAIRWDVLPLDDGAASAIFVRIGFEIESLGWLVKFFLEHHPEIQYGVFSGCAIALLESMKTALRE